MIGDAIPDVALPRLIEEKIEQFRLGAATYHSASFKEMALRSDFINPVIQALGWNVANEGRGAFAEPEVIQEDSLHIEGSEKAPDYCFLINSVRKFFLEAKRPSVNIATQRAAAYQIRRYCWSAGLPYGLVTDFEEFAIYDCRAIPNPHDSVHVGRIEYFRYDELPEKWRILAAMFGKDAVARGSLQRLAATVTPPRNTRPIDEAFLDEIRGWRRALASDVAARNTQLDVVGVRGSVQNLIDRIIFLRIAEARGLENYQTLRTALEGGPGVYDRLKKLFQRADDRYNSGLFHFREDASVHAPADGVSLTLSVSDALLQGIIERLYYPEPYEFSVLPADILGRIYEQFLGEIISINPDRTVAVDLKPDVRKAGGVYYTPEPIVRYIVEETIGPLLKGKSPGEVAKLRIVDPACGSGSFLISAYQYILDWHRDYYSKQLPANARKYLEKGSDGQTRVRTSLRKGILLNNIHGVDIDPQAVEVAKLSLLLKVIEGQAQLELEIGRILPDLDQNIVCGNSLIATDFPMPLGLYPHERLVYNPFDWETAFPAVFKARRFDAVIGNPPYLNVDSVWGVNDPRLAYIRSRYANVYSDKTDILFYFLEKAVEICSGEIGYIVSRSFLEADKAQNLRGWLAKNSRVREVLDFRHAKVFPKAGINTAIVRLTGSRAAKVARFARYQERDLPPGYSSNTLREPTMVKTVNVPADNLDSSAWNFGSANVTAVLKKIDAAGAPVKDILKVGQGMQTGRNNIFRLEVPTARRRELYADGLLYERVRNSDIVQYAIKPSGIHLLYLEDAPSFRSLPDDVRDHLNSHSAELKDRAAYKRGNCEWWHYTWPLHKEYFGRSRIWCPYLAPENRFALDLDCQYLGITDTTVLYDNGQEEDLRYILGVLNSRILTARFRFIGKLLGGGVLEYYENTVGKLPIPRRRRGDPGHDRMVELVTRREELAVELGSSRVYDEVQRLEEERRTIDAEIERLVAGLFGLTSDEVLILEEQLDGK